MALLKTYNHNKSGFTLIEMLIAIAILIMIFSFGIFLSINSYKGYIFRSEKSVLLSVLERARSRAINNMFESNHGVCFVSPNYIIFIGNSCIPGEPTNETISANTSLKISGLSESSPIVFEQLTGKITPQISPYSDEYIITLEQAGRVPETISINNQGRISW